jgi:hypothetical protein
MKELEMTIMNAVGKNASSGILTLSEKIFEAIKPEVKDIAIEFGVFRIKLDIQRELKRLNGELTENEIIQLQMNDIKQDADDYWSELFDQFIKEKYGTP